MEDETLFTKEEIETLKIAFGWVIDKKMKQTQWVLDTKGEEESVKVKKEQMKMSVKNYESILKKIGWEFREGKKYPTIFSFKKARTYNAS